MEYWLLAKVGMILQGIITTGYIVASGYMVGAGAKYIKDYKESVERENLAK